MHLYHLYKLNLCWTASPLCIFINSTNWICVGQLHRNASLPTLQIEFVLDSFTIMHLYQLYKLNLCWTASSWCIFINSTNWICVGQLHHYASLSTLQIEFVLDSFIVMHLYHLYKLNLCWTASPLCIFINSTNWICVGQLHRNGSLSPLQIKFMLDSFTVMHLYQLYKLNLCWTASPLCIFINSTNWICVGQLHRNASLPTLQIEFVLDSFTVMHLYQLYKLNLCWTASS